MEIVIILVVVGLAAFFGRCGDLDGTSFRCADSLSEGGADGDRVAMNVVIGVAIVIFGVLEFISIAIEIVGRRKESAVVRSRRILLHLGCG
jgi:hypothetical protein